MLKLQYKDQRKPAIWLVDARYSIGKDTQNNIILAEEGISPFHAEIRIEGDQVFISDTGSSYGTFVNGKRIQRRTELRSGDVIAIHSIQFMLVDPKQEASAAPEGATAITPALANIPITGGSAKATNAWSFKAKTGSIVGKVYPIPNVGKVVIGRANNCDIQLPANHVSRQHAEVQVVAGKLMVKDLNSSNGTFINRKKVSDGELKNGDDIRFDTFSFEVIGPGVSSSEQKPAETESTQHRPGVLETAARPKAEPPPKPAAAPGKTANPLSTTRIQSKVETSDSASSASAEKSGGGSGMMIVVIVLAIAGAAAWWFMHK